MSKFILRIELEGEPSWQVYDDVHDALLARNVVRTIRDTASGQLYQLPNATYVCTSDLTTAEVRDEVALIVRVFWNDINLIAANYNDAAFLLHPII